MKQKIEKVLEGKRTMIMYNIELYNAPHTIFTKNEGEKKELINFFQSEMKLKSVLIKVDTMQSNNDGFSLKLMDQEQIFYATLFAQGGQSCNMKVLNDVDVIIIDVTPSMIGGMFDELLESIRIQLGEPYLYGAKKFVFVVDKSSSWRPACSNAKPFFESYYYMDFRPYEYQLTDETIMDAGIAHCFHQSIGNPSFDIKEAMYKLLEQCASSSK